MIERIYVDMDGVLADLFHTALQALNRYEMVDKWPPGEYDMTKVLGISSCDDFWRQVYAAAPTFWENLPPYPWRDYLFESCEQIAPTYIVSKPIDSISAAGKITWLRNWKGPDFSRWVLTSKKELLAGPNRVLIDDCDHNLEMWEAAGGIAVQFPQVSNSGGKTPQPELKVVAKLQDLNISPPPLPEPEPEQNLGGTASFILSLSGS